MYVEFETKKDMSYFQESICIVLFINRKTCLKRGRQVSSVSMCPARTLI